MISGTNRIVLNTLAAYGRCLITFPLNLFGARWVLSGLGEEDFGISSVVGGMVFFVTFINAVLSGAVSRYYAYAIGRELVDGDCANDELKCWFNTTLSIHIILPLLLIACYPIFAYAVRHWLVIPPARVDAAIWVLRFSVLTSVLGFVNVPFTALFSAHQWIVELTVYALATSVFNFIAAVFVPHFNGDRLIFYVGTTSLISVVIMIVQNVRARMLFPAASPCLRMMFDWGRIRELMKFVLWRIMSGAAYVARGQGTAVITNLYFGPDANAAYAIGNQLSAQAGSLSQNLINALTPAATTAEGAGRRSQTLELAYRSCKFASLLVMLFAVPLALEVDEVMYLWLKNPPAHSGVICVCMMGYLLIDKLTVGQYLAIMADGRIGAWQTFVTVSYVGTLLLGWGFVLLGVNVYAVAYAYVVVSVLIAMGNIHYARVNVGMSGLHWLRQVVLRVTPVLLAAVGVGWCVTQFLPMSFARLCLTTGACVVTTACLAWAIAFSDDEKKYVVASFGKLFLKLHNRGRGTIP